MRKHLSQLLSIVSCSGLTVQTRQYSSQGGLSGYYILAISQQCNLYLSNACGYRLILSRKQTQRNCELSTRSRILGVIDYPSQYEVMGAVIASSTVIKVSNS